MFYHFFAVLILGIGSLILDPLQHLFLLLVLCLTGWFVWPKQTLLTSALVSISLVVFGHVTPYLAYNIILSHPVLLLVVGCSLAGVILKNDIHLVLSSYCMQVFRPSTELSLVVLMSVVSGFLSMWISNTSVVAMLIPVVLNLAKSQEIPSSRLLISIAYGATIGGMLTPIGSPANLVAVSYASQIFGVEISFLTWLSWAAPFVFPLWACLCLYFWRVCPQTRLAMKQSVIAPTRTQKGVMTLLVGCVVLWATQLAPFGGWSQWLFMKEEHIGSLILLACYFIRYKSQPAFSLRDLRHLPWSSIGMVVAGIFMAEGIRQYDVVQLLLSEIIEGQWLYRYQTLAIFGFIMSLITELCSNTAVTSLGLPLSSIMMKLSKLEALPCIFLITFSANSAFMLPTATPPNALILGTGQLSSRQMLSVGLMISACSLCLLTLLLNFI